MDDLFAVEPKTSQYGRIYVTRVERVFRSRAMLEVTLYHVAPDSRFGPWALRCWEP